MDESFRQVEKGLSRIEMVSILVLMDVSFRQTGLKNYRNGNRKTVSILVLMDESFRLSISF